MARITDALDVQCAERPADRRKRILEAIRGAIPVDAVIKIALKAVEQAMDGRTDARNWVTNMLIGDVADVDGESGARSEEKRLVLAAMLGTEEGRRLAGNLARKLAGKYAAGGDEPGGAHVPRQPEGPLPPEAFGPSE